jgi:hypothetical protein
VDKIKDEDDDDPFAELFKEKEDKIEEEEDEDDDPFKWDEEDEIDLPNQDDDDNDPFKWDEEDEIDLPNQDDDNISFVPPDILTATDACTRVFEEWDEDKRERNGQDFIRRRNQFDEDNRERRKRRKAESQRTIMRSSTPLK